MEKISKKKVLNTCNLAFAFWLAIMPVLCIVVGIFMPFRLDTQIRLFAIFYAIYLFVLVVLNLSKINWKEFVKRISSFPMIIAVLLFLWVSLSSVFNHGLNADLINYLSYFLVYICIRSLDKSKFKTLLYVFTSVMLVSVMLSLVFPNDPNFPGLLFNPLGGYSMQFVNPNYSAYVVATLIVVCLATFHNSESLPSNIFFSTSFYIFSWWLYCNGSFVPIATVYLFSFIMIVYYWIKEKKCPAVLVIMFVVLIPMSFAVDACPWWTIHRNTSVSFLRECIAVFDNLFHTNIGSESVAGADGWGRAELVTNTLKAIFANANSLFLGYGAGSFNTYRPHMHLVALWVDFGMFAPLFYVIICIWTVIQYIKSKCEEGALPFFFGLLAFFVMSFFGSMSCYSFIYVVPLFAICHTYIKGSTFSSSSQEKQEDLLESKTKLV